MQKDHLRWFVLLSVLGTIGIGALVTGIFVHDQVDVTSAARIVLFTDVNTNRISDNRLSSKTVLKYSLQEREDTFIVIGYTLFAVPIISYETNCQAYPTTRPFPDYGVPNQTEHALGLDCLHIL